MVRHTPRRFRKSEKAQKARAKTRANSKAAAILTATIRAPVFYTVKASHLSLSKQVAVAQGLYDPDILNLWREALAKAFNGVLFYALEVGEGKPQQSIRGELHAHLVAAMYDGPETIKRPSEAAKTITEAKGGFLGVLKYLSKPPERYSHEAELDHMAAQVLYGQQRTRGWLTSQNRQTWNLAQELC